MKKEKKRRREEQERKKKKKNEWVENVQLACFTRRENLPQFGNDAHTEDRARRSTKGLERKQEDEEKQKKRKKRNICACVRVRVDLRTFPE